MIFFEETELAAVDCVRFYSDTELLKIDCGDGEVRVNLGTEFRVIKNCSFAALRTWIFFWIEGRFESRLVFGSPFHMPAKR